MIDFHIHLGRLPYPETLAESFHRHGMDFNAIACEPWEWEIVKNLDSTFFRTSTRSYGIHPMIATEIADGDWETLERLLAENPAAHVGEAGLDKRYGGYEENGIQEQVLERQARLARDLQRDLQLHCVGDYGRLLKILKRVYNGQKPRAHVVFHRFGGDLSTVRGAQAFHPLFSLHPDSFRKKSTLAALPHISPSQIRFETDADESFVAPESIENTPVETAIDKVTSMVLSKLESVQELYKKIKPLTGLSE